MTNAPTPASAHYGDPCLHCRAAMADVASGPCPERAGNRVGQRIDFIMSQTDLDGIMAAINSARNTPLVAINVGMPTSPQEAANRAWSSLGDRLGFDGMSVEPGPNKFSFSAVAK